MIRRVKVSAPTQSSATLEGEDVAVSLRRHTGQRSRFRPDRITGVSILLLAALISLWELSIRISSASQALVPLPSSVAVRLWDGFASGSILPDLQATAAAVALGFVYGAGAGLVLAIAVAEWPALERLLSPYAVALQAVPKVALAPLIVVWLGYGLSSKLMIVALITFFPLFVNTVAGLKSTPTDQQELLAAYKATRWQAFRHVKIYNALPFIFAGLNIGVTLSVIGAIVGEFVGAQVGLGAMILRAGYQLDSPTVFAGLVLVTLIAAIASALVVAIGNRVVFWAPNSLSR